MKSKYLLLVGLLPLFYSCNKNTNVEVVNYQNSSAVVNEKESREDEACTVMYVGKDISINGKAIIARTSDAGPGAMMINATIFPHNSLANQTITSNKGFTYKMPETTYRYVSTPRNPVINKGHHWEASAINENGVGVSATLSCYNNIAASTADPLVPTGIGEDNIAEIVGATAKTAREGMEIIADIITNQGSVETNAIMTVDQNEAWYMEIYSGHQFAAVKCPDNKVLTAGNEFVFDSLEEMGINEEDTILSDGLYDIPNKYGFKKPENCTDVRHLNLFDTYSEELIGTGDERINTDNSHRRTWRGINLFAKEKYSSYKTYSSTQKYPAFYNIEDNTKLDIHSVTTFMRDRYEDILNLDNEDPNYQNFHNDDLISRLRYIGIENAYQVHVIQSNPELHKSIAATMWLSISNSNYTPFVPISCSANHLSDYYSRISPTYEYDDMSAANIFKKLNAIASDDRAHYGIYVQKLWEMYEKIWDYEYNELLNQIKNLSSDKQYEILTNYITRTQDTAVKTALFTIDDLTWHIMNDKSSYGDPHDYRPCVNVRDYATKHGYSYSKESKTVTLKKGKEQYVMVQTRDDYRPGDAKNIYRPEGEVRYGENIDKIEMAIKDDEVYIPYETLIKYVTGEIIINANDYRDAFNHAVWIIPTVIVVPIVGGLVFYFVSKRRHNKEEKSFKY